MTFDDEIALCGFDSGARNRRVRWRPRRREWPSRPIHFIVPFPAGGSTDVAARVVGDYLSRTLGQQIVVENKSGANGNIGIEVCREERA